MGAQSINFNNVNVVKYNGIDIATLIYKGQLLFSKFKGIWSGSTIITQVSRGTLGSYSMGIETSGSLYRRVGSKEFHLSPTLGLSGVSYGPWLQTTPNGLAEGSSDSLVSTANTLNYYDLSGYEPTENAIYSKENGFTSSTNKFLQVSGGLLRMKIPAAPNTAYNTDVDLFGPWVSLA